MTDLSDDSRLVAALSALDVLFQHDVEECSNVAEARKAVERAKLEDKRRVLYTYLQTWAACLSVVVEKALPQCADLLAANSTPDPIQRAEERMRDLLEPRIGHKLEPKRSPEEFGKWLSVDPESIGEWLTGGEKPSSRMVWWIATVSASEGDDLLRTVYDKSGELAFVRDDESDVDESLAEQWQGPAWLKGALPLPNESLEQQNERVARLSGRLNAQATQVQVALIQAKLWEILEDGFDRGRLKATVEQMGMSHAVPSVSPVPAEKQSHPYTFYKAATAWLIRYRGDPFPMTDLGGLHYIRYLLQHPRQPIKDLDLANALPRASTSTASEEAASELGLSVTDSIVDEALDDQGVRSLKSEALRLAKDLEEAREFGNHEKVEELRGEIEQINEQLNANEGFHGRRRKTNLGAERTWRRIAKTIGKAVEEIRKNDQALADHLDRNIKTGYEFMYNPPLDDETKWNF